MKKILSLLLVGTMLFCLTACGKSGSQRFSKDFLELFDTASKITAYDKSQKDFDEHFNLVYAKLEEYSKILDIYNSYDDAVSLKQVNEAEANTPVKVESTLLEAVDYGKKAYYMTDGRVNIAMGSVLSIWHTYRKNGISDPENAQLPDMKNLENAAKYTDIESISVDYESSTITRKDENVKIDMGAVAKGFVCDKIAQYIEENGIWQQAVVSLGGNIKTVGTKNNKPFEIAVESPTGGDYLTTLNVANGSSVVTSGGYQRYYTVGGKRYCHIINPDTLMPADYFESVTVISKSSALADALSTALFTLDIEDGKALLNAVNSDSDNQQAYALWVDKNSNITYSDNFKEEYL